MATLKTSVTELPESRVRVEAEAPVVIRQLGRETVLDEALRTSLGGWYVEAIDGAGIAPIGEPDLDVGDLPGQGEPLAFSIEIGVRPEAKLGRYKGLEVGRREPAVDDAAVEEQIAGLLDRLATLDTVERAAEKGDQVVVDYVGKVDDVPFEGGEGRDQLIELGGGRLIPGFEDQLVGASAGDEVQVKVTFPEEYPNDLGGKDATFDVTVHEVKAKRLPEIDDDFASEVSEFDTLDELREDIAGKLRESDERAIEREYEEAVLQAAADEAQVEMPEALIHARAHELIEQTLGALARQGINKETYLQITGKSEEDLAHDAEPDAASALRREAVLAAVVAAEEIDPSDAELVEALAPAAERDGTDPAELVEQLRAANRLDALREDVANRQALELLVKEATPISVEQAQAREKLWTPGKDDPPVGPEPSSSDEPAAGSGRIWTPGN
jgi:trigger factor